MNINYQSFIFILLLIVASCAGVWYFKLVPESQPTTINTYLYTGNGTLVNITDFVRYTNLTDILTEYSFLNHTHEALEDNDTMYLTIENFTLAISNYYNETEIETIFLDYYTKVETDNIFTHYYNTTQIDLGFTHYYNTTQINTLLSGYATSGHNHNGVYSLYAHTHTFNVTDVFMMCTTNSLSATLTEYSSLVGTNSAQTSIAIRENVISKNYTTTYCYMWQDSVCGASGNRTITLMVNGNPTSLTLFFSGASQHSQTSTTQISLVVGDHVAWKSVPMGTCATSYSYISLNVVYLVATP